MAFDDLNDLSRRKQYTATAGQTVFPYPFPIFEEGDLVVYVNDTLYALNSNYTVSGEGADDGGNVTFATGLADGDTVTIYGDTPIERTAAYTQNGPWTSARANGEMNRIIVLLQELTQKVNRAIRSSVKEVAINEMPAALSRSSKYLYFDSSGAPTYVTGDPAQPITHDTEVVYPIEGQTSIPVSAYTPGSGNLSVYLNGIRLVTGVDYAEATTTTITLTEAADAGDVIELAIGEVFDVTLAVTAKTSQDVTASEGQTAITTNVSYTPGNDEIEVFLNGAILTPGTDYTETNASTITMTDAMSGNDQVRIIYGQSYTSPGGSSSSTVTYPQTAEEIFAGVTPSSTSYPTGHPKRYGAAIDGATVDTTPLTTLFTMSAYHPATVIPGNYLTGPLTPPDNADITLAPGAILLAINTLTASQSLLNLTGSKQRVVGYGAKVQMTRADYTTGTTRHGVYIYGSSDTTVAGLEAAGCGGSGFFVGGAAGDPATGVRLIDCKGTNNRHNGLHVANAVNFRDTNGTWTTSNGAAPSSGVFIQPYVSSSVLDDVQIISPRCTGNDGAGVLIDLAQWTSSSLACGISVIDPSTDGNGATAVNALYYAGVQCQYANFTASNGGCVRIVRPVCNDETNCGIKVLDWDIDAPQLIITEPRVINPDTSAGSTATTFGGILLYNSTSTTTTPGNVIIERPVVDDTLDSLSLNSLSPYYINGLWNNVEISDPTWPNYTGTVPFAFTDTAVPRVTSVKPITKTVTGASATLTASDIGKLITSSCAGTCTLTLPDASASTVGQRFSFEVTLAQQLRIAPYLTEIIRGGTAGQYLVSSTIGDNVTLECDSATTWKVVSRFGTWSYV